jgi:hypothetical protein
MFRKFSGALLGVALIATLFGATMNTPVEAHRYYGGWGGGYGSHWGGYYGGWGGYHRYHSGYGAALGAGIAGSVINGIFGPRYYSQPYYPQSAYYGGYNPYTYSPYGSYYAPYAPAPPIYTHGYYGW